METKFVEILYCALKSGKASRKQLGFTTPKAHPKEKQLLAEMQKLGLLHKEGSKYGVTEKGEEMFRQKAPVAWIRGLEERAVQEFLEVVEKKNGKKLSPKQLQKISEKTMSSTTQGGLVEKIDEGKFRLSERGKYYLYCRLPLQTALDKVENSVKQLQDNLKFLGQEIESHCKKPYLAKSLAPTVVDYAEECRDLEKTLQQKMKSIGEISQAPFLANLVTAQCEEIREFIKERIDNIASENKSRLVAHGENIAAAVHKQNTENEALRQQCRDLKDRQQQALELLNELHNAHVSEKKRGATATKPAKVKLPSDKEICAAMTKAYREICLLQHLTKTVSFPELYYRLKKDIPDITIPNFKRLLSKLCDDAFVDLDPVDNSSELKHPEFGIPTDLGDLYYVSWR